MRHKIIGTDEGELHYWVCGRGDETIVFTHGAGMDHLMFESQRRFFEKNYKVILWDVPMHGVSRPWKKFSLQGSAEVLVRILDDEKIAQAHLVGQSMGGYISQMLIHLHSDRAGSFCAVDSSPIQLSYYSGTDRRLLKITPALLRAYPRDWLFQTIARQVARTPAAREYALETLQKTGKAGLIEIMGAVYRDLTRFDARTERVSCPFLIVYGELDAAGRVVTFSKRWAKKENRVPVVIPGAGHNSNMDRPDFFNRIYYQFLSAI